MEQSRRKKIIKAVIISILFHIPCAVLFFFVGIYILFALFANRYNDENFIIAGAATMTSYMAFNGIVWIVFSKLTRFKTFSKAFLFVGIPISLVTGVLIYSYIGGM